MEKVNIIGAGLAGLTAAITLAENGIQCRLISKQPSERAQSVLAEGGINAALDNMGEGDTPELHMQDTLRSGCGIADPEAVRRFTETAPSLVEKLIKLGVPFQMENGVLMQRPFGGQKKRRTVYAKSSTGKIVMSALIDEARKYEARGLIERYSHHQFAGLILCRLDTHGTDTGKNDSCTSDGREPRATENGHGAGTERKDPGMDYSCQGYAAGSDDTSLRLCDGVVVRDCVTSENLGFQGPVILALGGLNGFFPGMTTGTTANSGEAQAILFMQGVRFGNLEMIQYHPTTMSIPGKRCLVSEAARGEGGRLYIMRGGKPWYFMEEKYPEMGNLMPRDVVSREMYFVLHDPECGDQVYLDMTGLDDHIWKERLADLREEVIYYQGIDPKKTPLPVEPGIHYFMGGIDVDIHHRTNIDGLHAAGECCCQYHGANRLGGNSMIGAIYGGKVAAEDIVQMLCHSSDDGEKDEDKKSIVPQTKTQNAGRMQNYGNLQAAQALSTSGQRTKLPAERTQSAAVHDKTSLRIISETSDILRESMGIVRDEKSLKEGLARLEILFREYSCSADTYESSYPKPEQQSGSNAGWTSAGAHPVTSFAASTASMENAADSGRIELARAMIMSALARKESRGAHFRTDYPERDPAYERQTAAIYTEGGVRVAFEKK